MRCQLVVLLRSGVRVEALRAERGAWEGVFVGAVDTR